MILLSKDQAKRIIQANKGKHYTYGLCRKDGKLFYVGVGQRGRLFRHETDTKRGYVYNKLKSGIINKEEYLLYVLFIVSSDRDSCLKMEANVIRKFGRRDIGTGTLSNLTDGGDSGPNGCVYSEERLLKHTLLMRENADKIANTLKARYDSLSKEEQKEISSRLDGHRNNEKALKKIGEKSKERWSDPEYRKRLSDIQKESQSMIAEKHRVRMKQLWADPEYRQKMEAARAKARQKKLAAKQQADNNVVKILDKE
jgi:hypothetical protein